MFVFLFSCSGKKSELINLELIEFDVTKEYPENKLEIHDLADINYVLLQAHEDYLFRYSIVTLTKNFIIVVDNFNGLLFFDRQGNPVSRVYHRGEGAEEYTGIARFLYIEEEDDVYITVFGTQKIKVYSKDGVFKREYSTPADMYVDGIVDYDENNLLLYFPNQPYPFGFLSKTDGSFMFMTSIFVEKPHDMLVRFERVIMPNGTVLYNGSTVFRGYYAVKNNNNELLLMPYPLDTAIYRMDPDKYIYPLLIRKPSFEETDPGVFLHNIIETTDYLFFSGVRMEHDKQTNLPFPETGYLIDKNSQQIYKQSIFNKDFEGHNFLINAASVNTFISPNEGIFYYHSEELIEADKKNQLKGVLKETFDRMDSEDEYLFFIYRFK